MKKAKEKNEKEEEGGAGGTLYLAVVANTPGQCLALTCKWFDKLM